MAPLTQIYMIVNGGSDSSDSTVNSDLCDSKWWLYSSDSTGDSEFWVLSGVVRSVAGFDDGFGVGVVAGSGIQLVFSTWSFGL